VGDRDPIAEKALRLPVGHGYRRAVRFSHNVKPWRLKPPQGEFTGLPGDRDREIDQGLIDGGPLGTRIGGHEWRA
jgi:hypothetical protein